MKSRELIDIVNKETDQNTARNAVMVEIAGVLCKHGSSSLWQLAVLRHLIEIIGTHEVKRQRELEAMLAQMHDLTENRTNGGSEHE